MREILARVAEAIASTFAEVRSHQKQHPEFEQIGNRMLEEWEKGIALSLSPA